MEEWLHLRELAPHQRIRQKLYGAGPRDLYTQTRPPVQHTARADHASSQRLLGPAVTLHQSQSFPTKDQGRTLRPAFA